MERPLEQISGMVENVTYQNTETGFAVITLAGDDGELICVIGPLAGCAPGELLTVQGAYKQHDDYGLQFEAVACAFHMPESESAVLKYLSSGVIPGIGAALAKRIVAKFGAQALEVIARDPEKLCEIRGITPAKARAAGQKFLEVFGAREAIAAFAHLGLSSTEALAIYRYLGREGMAEVTANPYILTGHPLYLQFARVDSIAQHLEMLPHENRARTKAAILYTIRHNTTNGHTCLPKERLINTVSDFFRVAPQEVAEEIEALVLTEDISEVTYNTINYVYPPELLYCELVAAARLRELAAIPSVANPQVPRQIEGLEIAQGIRYAPEQKQAIEEALSRHLLVITGGPGTGKTTTVNAIIALYEQQADRVLLAAPTGRAAKRMAELTGRNATTIHRLLEVEYDHASNSPRFARNEKNPLRCDVLVVDEMSMVDASLFTSMLMALRPGARLIMMGDANQLPSVGPGNVLKGLLAAPVIPSVALTRIFRQAASSLIVTNAHTILAGNLPSQGNKQDDFFFLKGYGMAAQRLMCELLQTRLPNTYALSPIEDIQVLCPGRKGVLGTEQLNIRLQEILNPAQADKPEIKHSGILYRLGDKVMQVKNNYDIPFTRISGEPGAGAFNGDIGFIEEINNKTGSVVVRCEDRHVYYSPETLHELEMAYAVTIHKSQGSEFEAVVIPVSEVPAKLRYRNLLYTGITRARRLCVLVGEEEVLKQMVQNDRRNLRFSCFADFLQDEELM